jgi:hypothetical protein
MNKKLIELIRNKFAEKLKEKTGWGKNEVLTLHNDCINEAILEIFDLDINPKISYNE